MTIYEGGPDETLELAQSIAARSMQSALVLETITAELDGRVYAPTELEVQLRTMAKVGETALLLSIIDNPSKTVSIQELIDARMDEDGYQVRADNIRAKHGFEVSVEGVRQGMNDLVKGLESEGIDDKFITEDFAKELSTARSLAVELGVSVSEIYENEQLYYLLQSRTYTPEEYADIYGKFIGSLTEGGIDRIITIILNTIIPKEEFIDLDKEDIDEMVMEMRLDEKFVAKLKADIEPQSEAMRQAFLYGFVKTWGINAVAKLSAEQLDKVKPRHQHCATLHAAVIASQI